MLFFKLFRLFRKNFFCIIVLFSVTFLTLKYFQFDQEDQILYLKQPSKIKISLKYNLSNDIETKAECILESLDPWDPKIKSHFKITKPYDRCVKNEPLTFVDQKNFLLNINQTINQTVFNGLIVKCDWAEIKRDTSRTDSFYLTDFTLFNVSSVSIENKEYIKTRCYQNNPKKKQIEIIYEYVHYVILNKKDLAHLKNQNKNTNQLNVMLLVLDGVSLSSMKRALPQTLEHLKAHENFFLFEKHHVNGENTFQNLVPLLTNSKADDLLKRKKIEIEIASNKKSRKIKIEPPFDEFPFIWKNFSQNGYLTYFTEEWIDSTFYNLKYGFEKQPTDFYLRPFWLALYKSLSYPPTSLNSNPRPCYYNKLLHKISFDWLKSLERFYAQLETDNNIENVPRFGIVKVNEMSHDYLDRLFWIDNDLLSLLSELFSQKFLDNTLFILMGDHGHRFHSIRRTFIGKLEEKLPMFGMLIPRKFLNKNPDLRTTLKNNTSKLTTWYDVYETLIHFLKDQHNSDPIKNSFYEKDLANSRQVFNRPNGLSLFLPVPERNCQQAKIPEYLCSCDIRFDINPNSSAILEGVQFMIDYLNNNLLHKYNKICMKLELNKIIEVQTFRKNPNKYSVIFEVKPNNAVFDGTFTFVEYMEYTLKNDYTNSENSSMPGNLMEKSASTRLVYDFNLVGKIMRINTYGITSKCISDYFLKNYCYCLDYHKNSLKNKTKT